MKKITKLCALGLVLLLAGAAVFAIGFALGDFSVDSLSNSTYVMETYTSPSTEINSIKIELNNSDIKIVRSDDAEVITVEYPNYYNRRGNSLEECFIKDEGGEFSLEEVKIKNVIFSLFYTNHGTVTLTLPAALTPTLTLTTDTGDVILIEGADTRYESIFINSDTADVTVTDKINVNGKLAIETDTGDIKLGTVNTQKLSLETNTGDITLKGGNARDGVEINVDTGDVELEADLITSVLVIDSDTGDLELSDGTVIANEIYIETDTGDIEILLFGDYVDYQVMLDIRPSNVNINPSNGGPKKLSISSDTGDATVYFTE